MNEIITFKGLEWYVINETDKEKLLFLKDCLGDEMIETYFDKYTRYHDVQFNPDETKVWWNESYIRAILNGGPFLDFLGKENLNIMNTTLELDGKIRTTDDLVRLITVEEVIKLQKDRLEILETKKIYGYWTMNPEGLFDNYGIVFRVYGSVYNGFLGRSGVVSTYAVRPMISLKSTNLKYLTAIEEEKEIQELIKVIYILNNNVISSAKLNEFYIKYNSLRNFTGSVAFIELKNILAKSLFNANLMSINQNKVDSINEMRKTLEEDLGNSKKLKI